MTDYLQSLDSPKFNSEAVDEVEVSGHKSVRFSKFLSHEDLIRETFKDINKESKFRDSMIFNKLEDVLGLMNENDHFESTMKLRLSSDRFMRTKRSFDPHELKVSTSGLKNSKSLKCNNMCILLCVTNVSL